MSTQKHVNLHVNIARLRQLRKKRKLSVQRAADAAGVAKAAWYMWETGKRNPSPENFPAILDTLQCELDELLDYDSLQFLHAVRAQVQDVLEHGAYSPLTKANFGITALDKYADLFPKGDGKPQTSLIYADWRNPDLYAFESDKAMGIVNYTDRKPLVVSGPTRCGKTLRILEYVMHLHLENEGFRSLILRSDAVDLSETIRLDLRDTLLKYSLEDPLSVARADGTGGPRNFKSLRINKGEMVLGGMNRPARVLGTSYNLIFCSQLERFTEEQFNFLLTRCAGDRAGWEDAFGNRRGLLIADANPDEADHWIKQYEAAHKLNLISFSFEDNPLYFRKGKRTAEGEAVISQLDESLSGIYHDRFFKGLWCSVEGKVFDFDQAVHVVPEDSVDVGDYTWYRGCDFGINSPSVCLWIGEHRGTGDVHVYREFRHSKMDTVSLGREINKYTSEHVVDTVIDNDEDKQMLLQRHCNIHSQMTEKNAHSVMDGIHLIQDALRKRANGQPGGLTFNYGLRCNVDPRLVQNREPLSVLDEMKTYSINPDTDKPFGSDHGIDALRYYFLYRAKRKQSVGFGSGSARRQRRL